MTTPITIKFKGTADFDAVTAALAALNKAANALEVNLNTALRKPINPKLAKNINQIAQPRFTWDLGLKQMDASIKLLHKGKLEVGSYTKALFNAKQTAMELAKQQVRVANAFSRTGKNGNWEMYIPSESAVKNLTKQNELFNRSLSIQGEMLGAVGTKIQNWGKNAQWAGRQLMVGWTVPFAAAAAATGFYAYQIDQQLVRIEKVYDGAQKGLREMSMQTSKEITAQLGTSTKDNLDVMAQLAAIGKQGRELQRSTAESQRLATLGEMDRLESLQAVITLQSAFKMNTDDTAKSINYMNAVENATSLSMQDFAEALPRAAAPIAELGGSIEELGTVMVAMKERGVDAGEGANAIKTLMTRLLNPTRAAVNMFRQLTGQDLEKFVDETGGKLMPTLAGISKTIQDSNLSLVDQQRLISELGGAWQATRLTSILQGLASEGGQVAKAMELATASSAELAAKAEQELEKQRQSASKQFDIAVNTFLLEFEEVGQIALRWATAIVKAGTEVINFFKELPNIAQNGLIIGAAIAAIAGPLVMLVGLTANLGGVFLKTFGGIQRLLGGYKSLTIEQKAAALASDQFKNRMFSQADAAQVLTYQLDKLQKTYASSIGAGNIMTLDNGRTFKQDAQGRWQRYNERTGKFGGFANKEDVDRINHLIDAQLGIVQQTGQAIQKNSVAQKVFSQEALMTTAAVAGIGAAFADSGSQLEKWLTYGGSFLAILGLAHPLLEKMVTATKAMSTANAALAASQAAGVFGPQPKPNALARVKGFAGGAVGRIGSALGSGFGMLASGAGAAAIASALAIFGTYKLITAESDKQLEKQRQLTQSTDGWAASLGFVKAEIGEIRSKTGEVQSTFQSMVEKMKKDNAVVVDALRGLNGDQLMVRLEKEIYKLQTQGLSRTDIDQGIRAALTAAGKTKKDIEKIMSQIKVNFDFEDTKKDFDKFLTDVSGDIASSMKRRGDYQGDPSILMTMGNLRNESPVTERGLQGIQENAKIFYERLVQLDPAQQAYIIGEMQTNWSTIQDNFVKGMKEKWKSIPKDANFQELIDKYTTFDPDKGFRALNNNAIDADIANAANAMREFAVAFGNMQGLDKEKVLGLKNFGDLLKYIDVGSMSAKDAVAAYDKAVKDLEESGMTLSMEQKLQLAQIYATSAGLDAAKLAAGGYSNAQRTMGNEAAEARAKLEAFGAELRTVRGESNAFWRSKSNGSDGFDLLGSDPNAQAQSLSNTVQGIYSGAMSTVYDALGAQMEDQLQARMDRITAGFEARRDALERESKALDKSWDARMQQFQDDWEARMDSSKKEFKNRKKAIEDSAEAEQKAIENQIETIREQEKIEKEREEERQKRFEAEERRIQRLNELANQNINYNRAIAEGNLDEAARIQNNSAATMASWSAEDAKAKSQEAADRLAKEKQAQIESLESRKSQLQEEKQTKLEQLAEEEDMVQESLRKQQEMERRSLDAQKEMERERLQNRMDSLQKEQASVEAAERAKQEMNKRTLEIQLATLKAFVPKNEAELWAHIGKVQGAYNEHGFQLTVKGGQWGQIIGDALQNNVNRAREEMSNTNAWSNFGSSVANAITSGAFGMDLGSFFNMLITGQPPSNWVTPSKPSPYGPPMEARHGGGPVGMGGFNNRLGRKGNPQGDEIPTLLQRGEYVINRDAAGMLGKGYLDAVNSGKFPGGLAVGGGDVGIAGIMGAMTGYMMGRLINTALLGTQEQQMNNWDGSISGKPGIYGNNKAYFDADQIKNANIIANVGKTMGASSRDILIALMTAMQESTLRNLNYGDRDSLGLFQQRPSMGWGTAAEVTNPEYASRKFYESLLRIKNRNSMELYMAAQAVQRSAYPEEYAKWEDEARALMNAGVGSKPGALPGFGMYQGLGIKLDGSLASGKFHKPAKGVVTSEFGPRWGAWHDGIDIGAKMDSAVYATAGGTVVQAGWNNGGFGNWTLIDHGNGLISGYAHQNKISVRPGQYVNRGSIIGTVGSTGKSTGPHLHFQMGPGPGAFQNPRQWIPSLAVGGNILQDNVLANLHKKETVLTAPLSEKLKAGINNIDNMGGDTYNVNITVSGTDMKKQDIIDAAIEGIQQAQSTRDKRVGRRR